MPQILDSWFQKMEEFFLELTCQTCWKLTQFDAVGPERIKYRMNKVTHLETILFMPCDHFKEGMHTTQS